MQWEHRTLTGTSDEHQHQSGRNDESTGSNSLGYITLDERSSTVAHHDRLTSKREAERLGVVTEEKDTDQEEQVGKTCYDKCFLRGSHGSVCAVVEADEQIRAHTYQLPEQIHLEDIGGEHQS